MMKLAKTCFIAALAASATLAAMAESAAAKSKVDPKSAEIVERMKAMRLPAVRFKPPKTIVDAVEFFREASKKCDNPNIPKEKRGFKIILRTGGASVPEIPNFSVTNISFYEALELVCKVIEYEFSIIDGIVIVKPRGQGAAAM